MTSKLSVVVSALVAFGCVALAQPVVETQSNIILPDGRRNLVISNHSDKTITAFAYQFHLQLIVPGKGPFREEVRDEFKDSVLYRMEPAIGPGKQTSLPIGSGHAPGEQVVNSPVEFKAAVFDDGSSFGDPAWVVRIRDRRVIVIETFDSQIAFLRAAQAKAAAGGVARESLAAQLDERKAAQVKADQDPDHQRIINGEYAAMARNLTVRPERPIGESLAQLGRVLQTQRDKMAKASGIMFPAKTAPAGAVQQQ